MNNIEEVIENIKLIENNITKAWKKLLSSEFSEGMNIISKIFEDIDKTIYDIGKINSDNKVKIDINSIYTVFLKLEKAIKIPDYILISDIIVYEIKPIISKWRRKLEVNIL